MRLFLIRHGQTKWNSECRIQGWLDSPLTQEAVSRLEQIELPQSDKLIVFSSDLDRAVHSARIIAEKAGVKVVKDSRLRERNFGVLQGKVIDKEESLQAAWDKYHQRYQQKLNSAFGVESESKFEQRIVSFLSGLQSLDPNSDVVIVGHGEWLRAFINIIQGIPSWHYGCGIKANASPVILEWTSSKLANF